MGFFRLQSFADTNCVSKHKTAIRTAAPPASSPRSAAPAKPAWPVSWKIAISLLVSFHILAVFAGPWGVSASPLSEDVGVIRPYIDALGLNNGYRFFAPEPGPSHLIRYELVLDDGTEIKGQFPDRKVNRPRLLYHRHFMMSEFANTLAVPENARLEQREVFDLYVRSYARHLAKKYNARQVRLTLVEHLLPGIEQVKRDRISLEDPRLYRELDLGTFTRDQL